MKNEAPVVHLVGISGIGMSALARILLQRGYHVTGSSDGRTDLTDALEREGAIVMIGHAAENVGRAQRVVVSSAIAKENPELLEAQRRGIPVVKRGALLAEMLNERRGIAIAGTHGKSTSTAMLTGVLEAGGLHPAYAIGAERIDAGVNAADGSGEWFVAESDESDGSFTAMRPVIAALHNVENDHVSDEKEFQALVASFEGFMAALPADGLALVGTDDPCAARIAARPRAARTITYGTSEADVLARDIRLQDFGSSFRVVSRGETLGTIALRVPGKINVINALPAIVIGLELGIPFETIAAALAKYPGVRRRFEMLARGARMMVVDDYAHHPTAVAATIAAARAAFAGPIVVAFQPHRYTRTRYLAADFVNALSGADCVVLTEVYAASEPPIAGVNAALIGEPLRARGVDVRYADVAALPEYLSEHAPRGALALFLGAGSITASARRLAGLLKDRAEATV
jgi:UDP-N-acetylmuramate--alanine ligase